jgi:hypothetical protein
MEADTPLGACEVEGWVSGEGRAKTVAAGAGNGVKVCRLESDGTFWREETEHYAL